MVRAVIVLVALGFGIVACGPPEEEASVSSDVQLAASGQALGSCIASTGTLCSLIGDGESDADFAIIHTYKRACATLLNYGRSYADIEIHNLASWWDANILRVTQSTSLAGGIASIRWGAQAGSGTGQEFVASGGHGSGMGWNLVSAAHGECYNPTLGGSQRDVFRNLDGTWVPDYTGADPAWSCTSTSPWDYVSAQGHGPTDSAYYPLDSTLTLPTTFTYSTRMAFWTPAGWTGNGGTCAASYPADDGSPYNLSPIWLNEVTKVGSIHNAAGTLLLDYPMLQSDATFTLAAAPAVPPPAADNAEMDGRYAVYMQRTYTRVYEVSPGANDQLLIYTDASGHAQLQGNPSNCHATTGGYGCTSYEAQPLMWATDNGSYALGLFTAWGTTAKGLVTAPIYWAEHDSSGGVGQRVIQITAPMLSAFPVGANVQQRVFTVVGSQASVSIALKQLSTSCGASRTACYLK
jgi:hypothetical protein